MAFFLPLIWQHKDGDRIYRVVSVLFFREQLVVLLSVDFVKLVCWAFLIAVPLAWWGGHSWLENFAYRTNFSWWLFPSGGLLMAAIATCILLLRTFKAAVANPADNLRTE